MAPDLPQPHIAEISLFGTGGGYGESLVVHMGYDRWMVIDSCIDPLNADSTRSKCIPLRYLNEIGVDLSHVRLLLCTHWHDDHIREFSSLVDACSNAWLGLPWHHKIEGFLDLVKLDYEEKKAKGFDKHSATAQLKKSLDIMAARFPREKWGHIVTPQIDRLLYKDTGGIIPAEVFALSPLDAEVYKLAGATYQAALKDDPFIKPLYEPNKMSVATYLKLGSHHRALLGADLEGTGTTGPWMKIIGNSMAIRGERPSGLFKIPHHGSEGAYEPAVWTELLHPQPVAKLTPWNQGIKDRTLPQYKMLKAYQGHTNHLYITSMTRAKLPLEAKAMLKAQKEAGEKCTMVGYTFGHVRSRIDLTDPEARWQVEFRGTATQCHKS